MAYAHGRNKDSKVSRIKEWEQVEKSIGVKPEQLLNKPELSVELNYIWKMFLEVRNGCEKIGYQDLVAYEHITGADLSQWESITLIRIDEAWRSNG